MADVIHQVPMPPDELMRLRALRTLDILDSRSDSGNRALNSVAVDLNDALDAARIAQSIAGLPVRRTADATGHL